MMKILKISCFFLTLMMFLTASEAKIFPEKLPSLYNKDLDDSLKLSDIQTMQVKMIREKNQEKMNVFLMELETIHHEIAALVDENEEQIREILSEKQKVKFDTYKYKQKKKKNMHKSEEKPSRKKMRVY